MARTLNDGDIILVRLTKNVNVGDIILFELLGKKMVKRVKNIERDVEGSILLEVVGDNWGRSLDSRKFGNVHVDAVIGKVLFKLRSKFPFFEKVT